MNKRTKLIRTLAYIALREDYQLELSLRTSRSDIENYFRDHMSALKPYTKQLVWRYRRKLQELRK